MSLVNWISLGISYYPTPAWIYWDSWICRTGNCRTWKWRTGKCMTGNWQSGLE